VAAEGPGGWAPETQRATAAAGPGGVRSNRLGPPPPRRLGGAARIALGPRRRRGAPGGRGGSPEPLWAITAAAVGPGVCVCDIGGWGGMGIEIGGGGHRLGGGGRLAGLGKLTPENSGRIRENDPPWGGHLGGRTLQKCRKTRYKILAHFLAKQIYFLAHILAHLLAQSGAHFGAHFGAPFGAIWRTFVRTFWRKFGGAW
jgi:hypothetical protein